MDRIELNGVWYIKESLTLQNESYQNDYSVTNLNVIPYLTGNNFLKSNKGIYTRITTK